MDTVHSGGPLPMLRYWHHLQILVGIAFVYIGLFTYVDERGALQNRLITVWVDLEDMRLQGVGRTWQLVANLAASSDRLLARIFTPETFSVSNFAQILLLSTAFTCVFRCLTCFSPANSWAFLALAALAVYTAYDQRPSHASIRGPSTRLVTPLFLIACLIVLLLRFDEMPVRAAVWATPLIFFTFSLNIGLAGMTCLYVERSLINAAKKARTWLGVLPLAITFVLFLLQIALTIFFAAHSISATRNHHLIWPIQLPVRWFALHVGMSAQHAYMLYADLALSTNLILIANLFNVVITGFVSLTLLLMLTAFSLWTHLSRLVAALHASELLARPKALLTIGALLFLLGVKGIHGIAVLEIAQTYLSRL